MPGQAGTLETIALKLAQALQPLEGLDSGNLIDFLAELGLQFPPALLTPAVTSAVTAAATAAGALDATITQLTADIAADNIGGIVSDGEQLVSQIAALINALKSVGAQISALSGSLGLSPGEVTAFGANLAANVAGYLLISYLENIEPGIVGIANLLCAIDYIPIPATDANHPDYTVKKLRFDNLSAIFTSPVSLLQSVYQWGSPTFDGTQLLPRLGTSLQLLGFHTKLNAGPPMTLTESLVEIQADAATSPPGLIASITETLPANFDLSLPITGTWSVHLQVQGSLAASLQITATPPVGVSVSAPTGTLNGALSMNLVAAAPDASHPLILVGETGGSYLGASSFSFGSGITITANGASATVNPQVQFAVTQGTVYIDMSDADGFLADVTGNTPIQATFNLSATWQPDTGLHIQGGAQLQINLPLHLDLGPVTLPTLYLIGGVSNTGIPLEVSAALGVTLGPIQASVDRVGITANLSFPSSGGNLGPADLQIKFKPPNGLGIVLDMGLAAGGGYISFSPGQYAGVLQVSLVDVIQVVVIGVLDTVMPDGSKGYSFLLIITFDFPPIQLGFGFTLNSVGGIGGVNRTTSTDALQAGFRAHTLDMVLSPPDPIANAPQIISDINSFFPITQGQYVFGPLLTIGWGTPTLVALTLGVVLELPDPITIVILGLIDAGLPAEDDALIELHVEVLGVIDFGTQTLSIDGSLYDSSVLIYSLTGNMAFRLSWGATSNFVFSWGGFNPSFNTDGLNLPANMRRMSVSIGSGDNPRISSNSYFAVTSNCVQFGANVQAYAAAGGFSISGYLGFDVLIILSPFSFEFEFSASFDVAYSGTTLAGLNVNGTFSGPTPWHFHGSASIQLLFFSVSASVDLTWGSSTQITIPQEPVLPDLFKALQNPASWSAALPSGAGPTVTLSTPPSGSQTLLVHPMGTLTVKENVVPLDLEIARYGNAAPADGTEFSISSVQINAASESIESIQDYFAPGQFLNLSDADKLSDPSFEMYDAGVIIGSAAVLNGQTTSRVVSYDEIYIDSLGGLSRFSQIYQMPANIHLALSQQGAGWVSAAKNTGLAKYRGPQAGAPISTETAQYVVTSVTDLSVRTDIVSASGSSYYQARAALDSYLAANPAASSNLQVMPLHEVSR